MSTETNVGIEKWWRLFLSLCTLLTLLYSLPSPYRGVLFSTGSWYYRFSIGDTGFSLSLCLIQSWIFSDSPPLLPVITENVHFASWWAQFRGTKCGHGTELKTIVTQKEFIFRELCVSGVQTFSTRYISYNTFNYFSNEFVKKIHLKGRSHHVLPVELGPRAQGHHRLSPLRCTPDFNCSWLKS